MLNRILVPVDGSEHAFWAIDFAAGMAMQNNASVHLLHVAKRGEVPKGLRNYMRSEGINESPTAVYSQFAADRILIPSKDEASRKGVKNIKTVCLYGDPAEGIIDYAGEHECDLIVMGNRGLGNVTSNRMGSVSSKVCQVTDKTCVIVKKSLLDGKKVLIVDDEPDVLETLEELLPMCDVQKASTFEKAKDLLERQSFDLAILDIMGIYGYKLLDIANDKKVIAIMLTAHAFRPEEVVKSHKKGAASYVPKDKITHIATFLTDVLEARERGKNSWWRWLGRLGSYFDDVFGSDWQQDDPKFWDKFPNYY